MRKISTGILLPLLFITLLSLATTVQAQIKTGIFIKGIIADSSTAKSLELVTITLKNSTTQVIKTAVSKSDGSFLIDQVIPGNYNITFSNLGYSTKVIQLEVADTVKQGLDIGRISLKEQSNQLKDVAIVGDKPLIKQEIDRIAYDVQSDPESKALNVLDMMRKVPLLSLDGEDNIQLKGSGSYKYLLNGKPSAMLDRNAKDFLRAMPASSIKSIEVITDPPAKYDSEGLSGIINIITTKRIDNGYNATIFGSMSFQTGGPGGGASINAKQGKFGITGGGNFTGYKTPTSIGTTTRVSTLANPTRLLQSNERIFNAVFGGSNMELSYEIDSLNLLAGQFGYYINTFITDNNQNSELSDQTGNLQGYTISSHDYSPSNFYNNSVNYQRGFKSNKNRLLTFSYRNAYSTSNQRSEVGITNRFNYSTPDYKQTNKGSTLDQTFQMDYVHPLKKVNIEAGLKAIMRDNKSDFIYSAKNSAGSFIPDPSRSNKYNNSQNVFSAYNSYQYTLKSWGLRAGVRVEETVVNADFISSSSTVNQNYFNLIPSLLINKKFKNTSTMSLGFTQRIERPSISTLNPFIDRQNPNYENSGNPGLRPSLSNNINLSYSKFKKLQMTMSIGYAFANNTIQRISIYNPATNITSNNYDNVGRNKTLSSYIYLSYPFTKKFTATLNGGLNYLWYQTSINSVLTKNEGFRGNAANTLTYKFDNGWRLNGSFNYSSPGVLLQGRSNANFSSFIGANKELIKDKLTFYTNVYNFYSEYRRNHMVLSGANFTQVNDSKTTTRSFYFTLNYRFGKLKEAIKKNKRGINNDDVASGGQ